jgi:radical SAM superfamily enzyme YgiQ (UPF0313 family)
MRYPKLDEKKVLFITEPSMFRAYTGTRINAATQIYPIQAYQWLSGWIKKKLGLTTMVFDMGVIDDPWIGLVHFLLEERPKYIGLTVTTPLFYEASLIGMIAKDILGPEVVVVYGGTHVTALPEESLTESMCDFVVVGEGEITFGEICEGREPSEIQGVVYRADDGRRLSLTANDIINRIKSGEPCYEVFRGAVVSDDPDIKWTAPRKFLKGKDLDSLEYDLNLYDIWRYKNPRIVARAHPLIQFETSRGCPFSCNFCSAEDVYRVFSPDYVIDFMKFATKKHGIKEIRISDDQFLTNIKRGKIIAEKMIAADIGVWWNLGNGVRADRVDKEFLELAKRSGCYQMGAGFESGDQDALDSIQKSLDIQKSFECIRMIKSAGIEIIGFFMIGTPADTLKSMQKTIDFAKALRPDFAKVTVCIPFPDTRLFMQYERKGLILSKKWDDYNIHKSAGVYRHPNPELTPEVLTHYYNKFYSEFYSNLGYLIWKGWKSLWDGSLPVNMYYGMKTFFPKLVPGSPLDHIKPSYKKK